MYPIFGNSQNGFSSNGLFRFNRPFEFFSKTIGIKSNANYQHTFLGKPIRIVRCREPIRLFSETASVRISYKSNGNHLSGASGSIARKNSDRTISIF